MALFSVEIISGLSGIVGNLASNTIPDAIKPLLPYIWPIFALVMLAGIVLAIWQSHQQEAEELLNAPPVLIEQNRQRLLAKVRSFWIKGVLEKSLHGAVLIPLMLQEQPDAIARPWNLVLQEAVQSRQTLPPGTNITQVYDDAIGEMLILGEPGSGKSTLLLELARDLLDRAEKDNSLPMPLVFNLSSWAVKQQSLADWLVEEMHTKYQVPYPLAHTWITTDQVLPLLDGLDEVKKEYHPICVDAINAYRLQHGLMPMVVCSRATEYLAFKTPIRLHCAVIIQPITMQQIDAYLSSLGNQEENLYKALKKDWALQKLATTPLMLTVLTQAYSKIPADELMQSTSAEKRRQQVFTTYTQQMLLHRSTGIEYQARQTIDWLSWLARQLLQHNQTDFYLERMQPDWLPKGRLQRIYNYAGIQLPAIFLGMLISIVVNGLIFSQALILQNILIGGLLGRLFSINEMIPWKFNKNMAQQRKRRYLLAESLINGIIIGFVVGMQFIGYVGRINGAALLAKNGSDALTYTVKDGLHDGLISGGIFAIGIFILSIIIMKGTTMQPTLLADNSWKKIWRSLIRTGYIRNALITGSLIGLSAALSNVLGNSVCYKLCIDGGLATAALSEQWGDGLIEGIQFGLISGILSVILVEVGSMIRPTETIAWSWKSLIESLIDRKHMVNGIRFAFFGGLYNLISQLANELRFGDIHAMLTDIILSGPLFIVTNIGLSGLSYGLSYWLLVGIFQSRASNTIEEQHRIDPNEGIHNSAYNSILIGFTSIFIAWIIYTLNVTLDEAIKDGILWGINNLNMDLDQIPGGTLREGLVILLATGVLVMLLSGGLACLRHIILRLLLRQAGSMPWNYPRFLDYAADRLLLRKIGGGYIFAHRLLMEYFAFLSPSQLQNDDVQAQLATLAQEEHTSPTNNAKN